MSSLPYTVSQSYNVREIEADGNCLFRALSFSMYGTEDHYASIRQKIVKHVIDNWSFYSSFIIGDTSYNISITDEKKGQHCT